MSEKQYTLFKGNLFDEPVRFKFPGFDFAGCVITAQLRHKPESGSVIHDFVITPDFSTEGIADFRLQISEAQSQALEPRTYYGDVKIKRDSPAYGPFTVCSFQIKVTTPVTRES